MRRRIEEYGDIIGLPRPNDGHPKMPVANRAAQFMPFAALTGYEALVKDTVREKTKRPELSEGEKEELNRTLVRLSAAASKPAIRLTYVREQFETGDIRLLTARGVVTRIDPVRGILQINGENAVFFGDIIAIEEA